MKTEGTGICNSGCAGVVVIPAQDGYTNSKLLATVLHVPSYLIVDSLIQIMCYFYVHYLEVKVPGLNKRSTILSWVVFFLRLLE